MQKFEIRKASEQDIDIILKFILELAKFEKLENEFVANAEQLRDHLFVSKYANVIIGELDGKPICFALYFFNYSTFLTKPGLYLEDLFVLEEYRKHGFGTKMLKQLAKIAKANDCGRMEWAVLDWNENAIKVYEKIGAVQMSDWTTMRLSGAKLDSFAN